MLIMFTLISNFASLVLNTQLTYVPGRCLCHSKLRKFGMSEKLIMGNMADLMVREIWGAYEHAHKQRVMQLIRVVDCYSEALLFVEASQTQPWRILHLNDAAVTTTGALILLYYNDFLLLHLQMYFHVNCFGSLFSSNVHEHALAMQDWTRLQQLMSLSGTSSKAWRKAMRWWGYLP